MSGPPHPSLEPPSYESLDFGKTKSLLSVPEKMSPAQTQNLEHAREAAAYVQNKLTLGLDGPFDRTQMANVLRDKRENIGDTVNASSLSAGARHLWEADHIETGGIGNSHEHATVAFKYIARTTDTNVSIIKLGNDSLVAIGADPSQLSGASSGSRQFSAGQVREWPAETVIFNPRSKECFLASDLPQKISSMGHTNKFGPDPSSVKLEIVASKEQGTLAEYEAHQQSNTGYTDFMQGHLKTTRRMYEAHLTPMALESGRPIGSTDQVIQPKEIPPISARGSLQNVTPDAREGNTPSTASAEASPYSPPRTQAQNIEQVKDTAAYVQSKLNLGFDTPTDKARSFDSLKPSSHYVRENTALSLKIARNTIGATMGTSNLSTSARHLWEADHIEAGRMGNSHDHATVAFAHLAKQPNTQVSIIKLDNGDSVVAVGADPSKLPGASFGSRHFSDRQAHKWPAEAVIYNPRSNECFPAAQLPERTSSAKFEVLCSNEPGTVAEYNQHQDQHKVENDILQKNLPALWGRVNPDKDFSMPSFSSSTGRGSNAMEPGHTRQFARRERSMSR